MKIFFKIAIIAIMISIFSGCLSNTPNINWSKNMAIYANSKDSKFHDDNIDSAGESNIMIAEARDEASTIEADKYTQASLNWVQSQEIQKIIVKADIGELEFFEIEYRNADGNWQTLKKVKNNARAEYKLFLPQPIATNEIRLKIPRKWDSRLKTGQKRRTRGEGGSETLTFRKIREIEVYHAIPNETTADEAK